MSTRFNPTFRLLSLLLLTASVNAQTIVPCTGSVTLGSSGANPRDQLQMVSTNSPDSKTEVNVAGLSAIDQLVDNLDTSSRLTEQPFKYLNPLDDNNNDAASANCGRAVASLVSSVALVTNAFGGPGGSSVFLWLASTDNSFVKNNPTSALKPIADSLRNYDNSCLQTETDASKLAQAVGYLTLENGIYFCSAYRTSADEILTARHCIYSASTNTPNSFLKGHTVNFGFAGDKSHLFQVCGEIKSTVKVGEKKFAEKDDYIELKLSKSAGALTSIPRAKIPLSAGQPLKLFGLFPDLQLVTQTGDVGMRSTRVAGCEVKSYSPTCIVHACQTEEGTSGAPIFTVSGDGSLNFVGLHVGSYPLGSDEGCATPKPENGTYNEGLVITNF
ncbi:hypothetical protein R70006_03796 [Paraburkholderia domus]|uniref:trypsin-like serine peptidase n=1 Tax=Paraburkholderia domus TaxID=2793075 RepID=UPI0019123BEE|nr:hypothetical protein [Paraburkholderia domus]MBK5047261.1 hypothetical protein [Burkholderia sp. R-70006]CAE6767678.1 hypothetical protein R70006_03796 [Paraburkholderia domus]